MNKNGFFITLSESNRTQIGKVPIAKQSPAQRVFTAIWEVEAEVNNDGFQGYFLNSSAESVPFVVQALETVGAPKTADICLRAIEAGFPGGLPPTTEEIAEAAADFSEETLESLGLLDQEFFAYPHNLTGLLFDFVAKHPDEFGAIPTD